MQQCNILQIRQDDGTSIRSCIEEHHMGRQIQEMWQED